MLAALALLVVVAGAVEDDPRFQEARRLFESFELNGALARFNLILLDDRLSDEERARVLLWKGLSEAELGRFDEATEAFADALVLNPEAKLPLDASPKIDEMLEDARAIAAEREPPPVEVTTRGDGTVHPSGPGVLIKTTATGRMDAAVQERPPPPVVDAALDDDDSDAPLPWLLVGGSTAAGLGVLTLGGGGLLGALALVDHTRAVSAPGAKEASLADRQAQSEALVANVLYGTGAAIVATGLTVAAVGFFLDGAE